MRKVSRKALEKLAPNEPLDLSLAAAARGDAAELRRLAETCPRRPCTMRDPRYSEKLCASRRVALIWALIWQEAYRDYGMMALSYALDRAAQPTVGPVLHNASLQVGGTYLGLEWFCEQMALDSAQMIGAWCGWLKGAIEDFLATEPWHCLTEGSPLSADADRLQHLANAVAHTLRGEWDA